MNDAVDFYRNQQTARSLDNDLTKLHEQVKDSKAREGLIDYQEFPLISGFLASFVNPFIEFNNNLRLSAYEATLAVAQTQTTAAEFARDTAQQNRDNAQAAILGLNSVEKKIYLDENGVEYDGAAYINLAAISSVNTAEIENNGSINNRGLFNNLATITNNSDGEIRNSGLFIVGKEGKIDNAGNLVLEQVTINRTSALGEEYSYEQAGTLISNGTINNSGQIEINAGTLVNGTPSNLEATINNSGSINLTANVGQTANLINQGVIENESGGLIQIGYDDAYIRDNGLYSTNMLANIGQITNKNGANIENYGMLYNAGTIDNESGSTFINEGVLSNDTSGTITFADSTELGGYLVNNGLITITDDELLTLTGNISGNGTFAGDTLIKGGIDTDGNFTATVNPGNSPGLLTFDGNVEAENVNWVMEIWGTDRGVSYDAIDITGDFTLMGGMSLSILSLLNFDTLVSQEFEFFSITGDLFDELGGMLTTSFEFFGFSEAMGDNWAANWIIDITGGWSLNLAFVGDEQANNALYEELPTLRTLSRVQNDPTSIPEPSTLLIFISGVLFLLRRRKACSIKH